ncbi:MAG TPA: 1,2-phenylacetyl-CoA epoxidase subunit PaaD [Actinomycetes bacterium]
MTDLVLIDEEAVRRAAAAVPDPELPMVTIEDLGILRDVTVSPGGRVAITITPTYSGCPAMEAIAADVREAVETRGATAVEVRTELAPAWTTDWITEEGRRKLAAAGIAPPEPVGDRGRTPSGPVQVTISPRCPRCGTPRTRLVSRFGSTACKALYACSACGEPFDYFKAI